MHSKQLPVRLSPAQSMPARCMQSRPQIGMHWHDGRGSSSSLTCFVLKHLSVHQHVRLLFLART